MGDFWGEAETRAKLSVLRKDAVDAHLSLRSELSAMGFVTAQAKYTMALVEAQDESILDYVEINTS